MSWWDVFINELRAIFFNRSIVLTVFGGVIFYSFLYPLPYSQQVPREQKVVVVNLDESQLSRKLERMVDATPQVELSERAYSVEEAEKLFLEKRLAGILVIPENFYRDLLLGHQPTLSFAGDASYILVYSTVLEGMLGAGGTMSAEVKVTRMVMSGQAMALAAEQYSAIRLNSRPAFNETMGYVNYIVPAVFILILHQTLIIGVGLLGGGQNKKRLDGEGGYWLQASPLKLLMVRALIFAAIYWILSLYYFGFCFVYYGVPHLADAAELHLLLLPFLLSAAMLGICIGAVLPRCELATLIVLLTSMPLVFGAGFVWPTVAIPAPIATILNMVPVVPAIQGFLRLNQMGADFQAIIPLWKQLWLLAGGYGFLAWLLLHRHQALAEKQRVAKHSCEQSLSEIDNISQQLS
ncbi:ABC transporter permease [Desulfopila aestuarii]|uniref:ABC-2 type transport system permease protein n=1 Tax=Desulfopila aestuarii DSM 18488 TaxID=1121416 RepID=A0A1M7Y3I6_9BACT|nr:ABC transporter permease [Desulfopila aestuarii]SHO46761.1 ABC-2 type transport system permease protein [Desulfopila aestuarii DSM 18488]